MGKKLYRAPKMITVEPIGAVTPAPGPIPVVALYRWAPPFGDGGPHPRPAVAVAWTVAQVLVRRTWPETHTDAWLPAHDVMRIRELGNPTPVVARVTAREGVQADVPGLALARTTDRRGRDVAVKVLLAPGTDDAREVWLMVDALVDDDPLDDVAG